MTSWKDTIRNPNCTLCPLHEEAKYVCLMGSGMRKSKVMIIGEAPGAREDESHRAFVGAAGKLLDQVLPQIGLKREDCYITNVAKCRPPKNRTPELKEVKICVQSYLLDEFEQVRPAFVLLLGNSALRGVVGKSGITKHNGTVYEIEVADGHYAQVMATLHPAAILRNPRWLETFSADMMRFGNLIKGIDTSPTTRIKLILTAKHLKWFIKEFMGKPEISWDVETDTERDVPQPFVRGPGQDWHGAESLITSIALSYVPGLSYTFPIMHPQAPWRDPDDVLDAIKPVMLQKDTKYIAHNGKFDAIWMHSKGIPVRQSFDTMLAAHMLDENRPKGLKPLSKTQLAAEAYDVGEDVKNSRLIPIKRLCRYNARDADYTLRLYHIFREQLKEDTRLARVFQFLMMPASNAFVDIERAGVPVDMDRWNERFITAQENRDKLYAYINQYVPESLRPINFRSPQQVAKWLFSDEGLGFEPIELTKTKKPSTKESVLLRLFAEHDHKALTALMKYRKWEKYVNTYLGPWRYEWMDKDCRLHSRYKLFGTVTGRLSGEGGIQQVPRDPFIRSIIGAPSGWKIIKADFSQVELRIAAMLANERTMLRQFIMGEDIHMIRAMKMVGTTNPKKVSKEQRKKAKAVNFGYVYGMGAAKFVTYAFDNYDLRVTLEEANADREQFFADYPGLRPWHKRQRNLARRYHRVVSPIGRIRHLPDILSGDEDVRAEAERQAINSPVQSTASDLMLMALIELHRQLDPKECFIIFSVHDELGFQCREDKLDEYGPLIKEVMEDMDKIRKKFGTEITVPIVAEVEYGTHWGESEFELTEKGWTSIG